MSLTEKTHSSASSDWNEDSSHQPLIQQQDFAETPKLAELASKKPSSIKTTQIVAHFICALLELETRDVETAVVARKRLQGLLDLAFPDLEGIYPRYFEQPARPCLYSSFVILLILDQIEKRFQSVLKVQIENSSLGTKVAEKKQQLFSSLQKIASQKSAPQKITFVEQESSKKSLAAILLLLFQGDEQTISDLAQLLTEGSVCSLQKRKSSSKNTPNNTSKSLPLSLQDYELVFLYLYCCAGTSEDKKLNLVSSSFLELSKKFDPYQLFGLFSFFLEDSQPRSVLFPSVPIADHNACKEAMQERLGTYGARLPLPSFSEILLFEQGGDHFWSSLCQEIERNPKSLRVFGGRWRGLGLFACAFLDPRFSASIFSKLPESEGNSPFYLERTKRTKRMNGAEELAEGIWRSSKLDHLFVSDLFSLGLCYFESNYSLQKQPLKQNSDCIGHRLMCQRWEEGKEIPFALSFSAKSLEEALFPKLSSSKNDLTAADAFLCELVFPIKTPREALKSFTSKSGEKEKVLGGNVFDGEGTFEVLSQTQDGEPVVISLQAQIQSPFAKDLTFSWYLHPCSLCSLCSLSAFSASQGSQREKEMGLKKAQKAVSLSLCVHPQRVSSFSLNSDLKVDLSILYRKEKTT